MSLKMEQYYALVISIWSQVLELDPAHIKADEHLLLQGGDSLHLARILARLQQQLGIELNPARFSGFATPKKMAACCYSQELVPKKVVAAEVPAILLPEYPATGMQQGLWFAEQLSEHSGVYASGMALHLQGELDKSALQHTLQYLLETMPVFNSCFKLSVTTKSLQVHAITPQTTVLEQSTCPAEALPELLQQLLLSCSLQALPYRFVVLTLAEKRFCLALCCHHIICDGWSVALLLRSLCTVYNRLLSTSDLPEAKPDRQFQAYALREANLLKDSAAINKRLQWWKQTLAATALNNSWLWRQAKPTIWPHRIARAHYQLDKSLIKACQHYALQHELGIFIQMLTAWLQTLREFSGVPDQLLGIPVADRQVQEEDSIGCFTRLLMLSSKAPEAGDLLGQAKAVEHDFHEAQAHWLPLNILASALKPPLLPDGNPWLSQLFAFQNFPSAEYRLPGLEMQLSALPQPLSQHALKLEVLPQAGHWQLQLEYAHTLFEAEQVMALLKCFHSRLCLLVLH